MVKIINPLGDVKIGRQGEVVYQRKYGEQIRRQVSPKRAIASEAQIAHRQLYRDALTWRKALSLPNRRYLEGYCIAGGIVDSYHIPLAWSRFALKLYLQAVKFVLTNISVTAGEDIEAKFESYETGGASHIQVDDVYMCGQTFTPLVTHTLTRVILRLFRQGTPPICRISIYACDGEHLPTGSELSGVDKDLSGIGIEVTGNWITIDLPPCQVLVDTEYAVTIDCHNGNSSNRLQWKADTTSPTYARGITCYYEWAAPGWIAYPSADFMFQEWSIISVPGLKTGTLHIRHPALLSIVHKRGELTVGGYDTLSSLDEEYLTGQVGVDVVAGDTIKATTLCGIAYRHQVR